MKIKEINKAQTYYLWIKVKRKSPKEVSGEINKVIRQWVANWKALNKVSHLMDDRLLSNIENYGTFSNIKQNKNDFILSLLLKPSYNLPYQTTHILLDIFYILKES